MVAVSNSGPLIVFARARGLDLLPAAFGEILVPPAVWEEVVVDGASRPGVAEVAAAGWIRRQPLGSLDEAGSLLEELGRGEAEAIALATEVGPRILFLLDDRKGRRLARERNLLVVGSAGVLVVAEERGAVSQVRPVLDELRSAGLYLTSAVIDGVLVLSGEAEPPTTSPERAARG